jgi:hypothetical protein
MRPPSPGSRGLKRPPVVGKEGELIGIISRADVLGVYIRPDGDILAEVRNIVAGEFGIIPDDFDPTTTDAGAKTSPTENAAAGDRKWSRTPSGANVRAESAIGAVDLGPFRNWQSR